MLVVKPLPSWGERQAIEDVTGEGSDYVTGGNVARTRVPHRPL